jgi:hypothetical protein
MKKFLLVAVATLLTVAMTVPASALEVKFGGYWRVRYFNQADFVRFCDDTNDASALQSVTVQNINDPNLVTPATNARTGGSPSQLKTVATRVGSNWYSNAQLTSVGINNGTGTPGAEGTFVNGTAANPTSSTLYPGTTYNNLSGLDRNLSLPGLNGVARSTFPREYQNNAAQYANSLDLPHRNRFDQRIRIYMDFIASENLRVVTRFQSDQWWGTFGGSEVDNAGYFGGNTGAGANSLRVMDVFADFNIPNTPLNAKVGIQPVALLDQWIANVDMPAAILTAKLAPFTVMLGYAKASDESQYTESDNIDDLMASVEYKGGPFTANGTLFWQDAHNTAVSVYSQLLYYDIFDPIFGSTGGVGAKGTFNGFNISPFQVSNLFLGGTTGVLTIDPITGAVTNVRTAGSRVFFAKDNNLVDLGLSVKYKIDMLEAYVNFVKNLGSVDLYGNTGANGDEMQAVGRTADYTGWMIDGGAKYFCGPFTFNLGGFYTSGAELDTVTVARNNTYTATGAPVGPTDQAIRWKDGDINQFSYPLASAGKWFSEILGGGVFDNYAPGTGYWGGYPFPFNLWTINAGAAWQVLPTTKISASYWYFGTANDVPSHYSFAGNNPNNSGHWSFASDIGHEFDVVLTQKVVDNLMLDLVGAYLITGDAYRMNIDYNADGAGTHFTDNVYELGVRLSWAF